MSQSALAEKPTRGTLNGVNTPALFATIDAVRDQRELAQFRFRATNTWQSGTQRARGGRFGARPTISLCLQSGGFADRGCNSFTSPVDIRFVSGGQTSLARLRTLGHLSMESSE